MSVNFVQSLGKKHKSFTKIPLFLSIVSIRKKSTSLNKNETNHNSMENLVLCGGLLSSFYFFQIWNQEVSVLILGTNFLHKTSLVCWAFHSIINTLLVFVCDTKRYLMVSYMYMLLANIKVIAIAEFKKKPWVLCSDHVK